MQTPDLRAFKMAQVARYFRGTIILTLIAVLFLVITLMVTVRVQRITGSEIGVKVNNLTGNIEPIEQSGTIIYNGLISSFYVLDKTEQRLEMSADTSRGDIHARDDLRIKTTDGSDVFLDLTINFILRPDKVAEVVANSGVGDAYKLKWVRDYSRSICRSVFGELTTEEFYNANKRNLKAQAAQDELNTRLKPYGIEITKVIAENFLFHEEYRKKIGEKKIADQGIEEEMSRAKAMFEKQMYQTTEATKQKEVVITTYKGEMDQLRVTATAEAGKQVTEAEAYDIETRLDADAQFFEKERNAKALLATAQAEAEGLRKMAEALQGEGGHNIVKLSYTDRLQTMTISGKPYVIDARTSRFTHTEEEAAASKARPEHAIDNQNK